MSDPLAEFTLVPSAIFAVSLQRPIIVWSAPRSTSTALERAFIQRDDTEVLHEPFGEPYYYGPERLSKRFSPDQCAASQAKDITYSDVLQLIMRTQAGSDGKLVVAKDMAQYIVPSECSCSLPKSNPFVISDADLKKFRHTFLIRTPQKTIPSYYRATIGDCGDFGKFDPGEAGFSELRALLEHTRRLLPEDPVVVLDSADLVAEPERVLRAFCLAVGIPFQRTMLSWENRRIPTFDKWKGFVGRAAFFLELARLLPTISGMNSMSKRNSTGFREVPHEEVQLPQIVTDAIDFNLPTFEYLTKLKLKV